MKTAWTKVKPHTKKITAIWVKKNLISNQSNNKSRNFNNNSKRCKWDRPIILTGLIKAMDIINQKWIRNTIKIMIMASESLMRMMMTNPEKKNILMIAGKEQWTSRKRKVNLNNNETLKTVMTLKITIIKLIKKRTQARKNILILRMNKVNCQRVMIGTKRKKIEIITRTKRDMNSSWVKMKEAIRTMLWMTWLTHTINTTRILKILKPKKKDVSSKEAKSKWR